MDIKALPVKIQPRERALVATLQSSEFKCQIIFEITGNP